MPLLHWHTKRFNQTRHDCFGIKEELSLKEVINVHKIPKQGLFKCRIIYDKQLTTISFLPYQIRPIRSLQLVIDNEIDYTYKYEDRTHLESLFAKRHHSDDILIVKNGYLTDTFYANIVLENAGEFVTPTQPLLNGVRRTDLLAQGKIQTLPLRTVDLKNFERIHLINALMDLGDCVLNVEDVHDC